ncbi:hypothetical protein BROUX41_004242 [Berkeleyomyces rouxiae]|uniref:uncharacterized protein n=1 Tax=Berkeleyomyces rouxiae TaxID=2035830 RepID=UPI003B79D68A
MASRLDRIVTLLETGSTRLIRETAVNQLADWQKQQPEELFNLLARVVPYLRHKDWETRVTAGNAIGKIVENSVLYDPNEDEDTSLSAVKALEDGSVKKEEEANGTNLNNDLFSCATLNIANVALYGRELLRGGPIDVNLALLDSTGRLNHLKKTLNGRLGLFGRKFNDEEIPVPVEVGSPMHLDGMGNGALLKTEGPSATNPGEAGLSTRQLNVLKRKRKREAQKAAQGKSGFGDLSIRRSNPTADAVGGDDDDSKKGKVNEFFNLDRPADVDEDSKVVSEFKGPIAPVKSEIEAENVLEGSEWPFERLCEFLKIDLFDTNWETRHGAAIGIGEVIRVHGVGAGRLRGMSRDKNNQLNEQWLNDLACRLCCVLILDRFSDYSSDTSVAPIRETVGQTLGSVLKHLPSSSIQGVYQILYRMVMQTDLNLPNSNWGICHGGMIGLRYVVAVRKDQLLANKEMVDGIAQAVMKGLADADDDVRSASAATLIPIAKEFVDMRPLSLDALIDIVWNSLSNLGDDLSASTGKIMDLLATMCSFPEVLRIMQDTAAQDPERSFSQLVPRLYPFLRHTITSVRLAVLKALVTFAKLEVNASSNAWLNGRLLRLIFQNILVERDKPTLEKSMEVWSALVHTLSKNPQVLADEFGAHSTDLVELTLCPIGTSRNNVPMKAHLFQKPSGGVYHLPGIPSVAPPKNSPIDSLAPGDRPQKRRRKSTKVEDPPPSASGTTHDVDGHMMQGDVDLVGMDTLIRSRVYGARALGLILAILPANYVQPLTSIIAEGISRPYSSTQWTAAMIIDETAKSSTDPSILEAFVPHLQKIIDSERPPSYRELVGHFQRVRSQCQQMFNIFRDHGKVSSSRMPLLPVIVQGEAEAGPSAFSLTHAEKAIAEDFDKLKKAMSPGHRMIVAPQVEDARTSTRNAIEDARSAKALRDIRVKTAAASAIVAIRALPKKPSILIKSIMDSVKSEENLVLQNRASGTIAQLVHLFVELGRRGPADKVVANLVKFSCMEVAETPEFPVHATKTDCILSMLKEEDRPDHADAVQWAKEVKAARITRRGAKEALEMLSHSYGPKLLEMVPSLRHFMEAPLVEVFSTEEIPAAVQDVEGTLGQDVVDALSVIRTLTPSISTDLHEFVLGMLPYIIRALHSKLSVFRYMAAKCLATICSVITVQGMTALVEKVLPSISNPVDLHYRQGATEVIYHLIAVMGDGILPYVIFLIVPVLGRMSDSDNDIRLIATTSFATLVKLVPLEAGIPDPPGLSEELLKGRDRERTFISQLLDPKKVEAFKIPVAIKAELRSYQQEGVNWLHFLNKYHLHGILCDDMGLGKTLQTICIVSSDHHQRAEEFAKTGAPDVRRLPSLIVCPPTLPGHWLQELKNYAPFLSAVAYVGSPAERRAMQGKLEGHDIVITSYDVCRNDIGFLDRSTWNYVVLDEGHLIKNPRAKITLAVKKLASNHRLILTGTPIQNNVLELWSLFDFLMPGFLGAEKVFHDRFSKPIGASRHAKASSKEQEAGALAIEALHKQVLPFLLRRLKEEVLNDLPPKILQNYYCDMSDLQKKLFEDFVKTQGKKIHEEAAKEDKDSKQHIFQALQYMRKLCNSPALVLKPGHRSYDDTQQQLAKKGTRLEDPSHAPKLTALRDLLVDCGIGVEGENSNDPLYQPIKPHRALIFCQMKEMLDMVQNTVLKAMLPSVSYLRLDGSVEANRRQDIVNKFNGDPSYDVLLLTTSVGGLGLNLTGADTVIFVEHDWNPQKDLQAMDRAHRIGQKKVVNVYRLITRGTLEEKILSLQRFKIDVASTVVNQQNAGLATMDTDQILDLFSLDDSGPNLISDKPANNANGIEGREEDMVDVETGDVRLPGKKAWTDGLGELWDNKEYEESFDLDGFLKKMQ